MSESPRIEYVKVCNCRATASTGMTRIKETFFPENQRYSVRADFYAGPSCNECGTPWRLVDSNNTQSSK